jgi:hypothetical protein
MGRPITIRKIESEIENYYEEGFNFGRIEAAHPWLKTPLNYPKLRDKNNRDQFISGWIEGYRQVWLRTHKEHVKDVEVIYPTIRLYQGINPEWP